MIVYLTSEAEYDLEMIGDFIARDNPARALTFLQELRSKCLGLADMPERFPLVPRYEAAGVRRCVHGDYLIFYRVELDRGSSFTFCMAPRTTARSFSRLDPFNERPLPFRPHSCR